MPSSPRLNLRIPGWLHARTIVAALLLGAVVHIATTLLWARMSATKAFDAIALKLPPNRMTVLSPTTANDQLLPFQSPDMRYAICRFDARDGSVAVKATLPGPGWSLSLHSADGDNFFVVTGQDGRKTELSLLLVPQSDEFIPVPRDVSGTQAVSQIALSNPEGLIMVRGPIPAAAYRFAVETELLRASCVLRKR